MREQSSKSQVGRAAERPQAGRYRSTGVRQRRQSPPLGRTPVVPAASPPGRSIVTRRAIRDIVRTAVVGSYGVLELAEPTLAARIGRWMGMREPGITVRFRPRFEIDVWLN